MDKEIFIAFDAGGTKTRCAVASKERILSRSEKGSGNIYAVGLEAATANILSSFEDAILKAGIKKTDITAVNLAGAGCGKEENRVYFERVLNEKAPKAKINICNDSDVLLGNGSGIALIAGTGSICFSKDKNNNTLRAGGFGWRLGDEGSAFHLAFEAIRRSLRSEEAIDLPTKMVQAINNHFNVRAILDVIYIINDPACKKEDIASFAPLVIQAAEQGDELAMDIIDYETNELLLLIQSIIKRIKGDYEKRIVISGGLLINSIYYRNIFESKIKIQYPEFTPIFIEGDTALLLSLEMAKEL